MSSACAWCGERALADVEVQPAEIARDGSVKRAAIVIKVCATHRDMVEREREAARERKQRAIKARRLGLGGLR